MILISRTNSRIVQSFRERILHVMSCMQGEDCTRNEGSGRFERQLCIFKYDRCIGYMEEIENVSMLALSEIDEKQYHHINAHL